MLRLILVAIALALVPLVSSAAADDTFSQSEILAKARGFFGETTQGLAKAIEKVFEDKGRPNGYIVGEEAGGAIAVGVRYGKGDLNRKGSPLRPIFWQGPTIGLDVGGNASKVFALIYNLRTAEQLYQRFPGVEGSLYIVAGLSVNYQQSGDVVIAPIRTGVGLRAGANVGYIIFTREHTWNPL
jgi:hypothetical protein